MGGENKIAVTGDGQLARMLLQEGFKIDGLRFVVCGAVGKATSPAGQVLRPGKDEYLHCDFKATNLAPLAQRIAQKCRLVVTEWETVPAELFRELGGEGVEIFPGSEALEICQDRLLEKGAAGAAELETAKFFAVDSADALIGAAKSFPEGSILKTRFDGYDGHGQKRLTGEESEDELRSIFESFTDQRLILEELVDFVGEASVIVGRDGAGNMVNFEPIENIHRKGILRVSVSPARIIDEGIKERLVESARKFTESLGVTGILAVEMFITSDGRVLINEAAPRPHNSGHGTIEGFDISQYKLLLDVMEGKELRTPQRQSDTIMRNILGTHDQVSVLAGSMKSEEHVVHAYGKEEKAGSERKLGHVTDLFPRGTILEPYSVEYPYAVRVN